jgi:hypothetical protein
MSMGENDQRSSGTRSGNRTQFILTWQQATSRAYWLGSLFADGYITRKSRTGAVEIGLKLNQRDEETIDNFCEYIGLNKDKKIHIAEKNGKSSVLITFACKGMSNDLLKQGLMLRKSKRIKYPELSSKSLELAFLLGYYDGDGTQNTTMITSGSLRFLEQIRDRFCLHYKIQRRVGEKEILGKKTWGTEYFMYLGAELFNEIITNYDRSMPRKRWFPCDTREKARRAAEANTSERILGRKELQREWKTVKKDELESLVRAAPLIRIAKIYNVTDGAVLRKCERRGITRPRQGYWTKIYWEERKNQ